MDLVGSTLGRYQVVGEIGRGGMAILYKAYQASLNRYLALKVLPPELTFDAEFVPRFQQEARTAGGLDHPHIVPIYDVGEENGIYYIAMKYVEGQSLHALMAAGKPLSIEIVVKIVTQVASALDYAHPKGIIHRDIKPSNILVDAQGQALLTDFGIARAAEGTRLTKTGILMGTPAYMSPEQIQGPGIDWRTDIYSLGVVTYEMLAGRAPFSGDTVRILYAHVHTPPPPWRALNPKVPVTVEEVVAHALAKNPIDRPQQAGELAQNLAAAARGKTIAKSAAVARREAASGVPLPTPLMSRPPSPVGEQSQQRGRRISPWVGVVVGIVALLVLAVVVVGILAGGFTGIATSLNPTPTPTVSALSLAASTPTSTPAIPTATPQPTATLQPTATPQPTATATPIPTATLMRTATPTQIATATAAPTVAIAPPPQPTATSKPAEIAGLTGRIAFSVVDSSHVYKLYLVNPDGSGLAGIGQYMRQPDYRLDGQRLVVNGEGGGRDDLWTLKPDGSDLQQLTKHPDDQHPVWASERGSYIVAFDSTRAVGGQSNIYVGDSPVSYGSGAILGRYPVWLPGGNLVYAGCNYGFGSGSNCGLYKVSMWGGTPTSLTSNASDIPTDANAASVLFMRQEGNNWDVCIVGADGLGLQRLTENPTHDGLATFSPDGQAIAFVSNRSGVWALWIMNRDGTNQRKVIDLPEGGGYGSIYDWTTERISWGSLPAAPIAVPTPIGGDLLAPPSFVWPRDIDVINPNKPYRVEWTWSVRPLGDNEGFEVRLQDGAKKASPQGLAAPTRDTFLQVTFAATDLYKTYGRGLYYLDVVVVQVNPYKVLSRTAPIQIKLDPKD